jgi:insertion element IS1 protein InsB
MLDRLLKFNVSVFFADNWDAYAELIPSKLLVQTKTQTHGVERDNFRQRHWFGRFRRKTCIVSRCKQMVDITMSLFARFRVNGTPNMIASFFK